MQKTGIIVRILRVYSCNFQFSASLMHLLKHANATRCMHQRAHHLDQDRGSDESGRALTEKATIQGQRAKQGKTILP